MIKREQILGELGKIGGKLFVSAAALRKEVENISAEKLELLAKRLDLVRRSEFEAVQAVAKEARRTQAELESRIASLEKILGHAAKKASKTGAKKPETKKRK